MAITEAPERLALEPIVQRPVRSGRGVGVAFDVGNHLIIGLLALLCVVPFVLVTIASFSAETSLEQIGIWFVPQKWSTLPYEAILKSGDILRSYEISVGVTAVGTTLSILLMSA